MKRLIVSLAIVAILYCRSASADCGYKACPQTQPNMMNVHLTPHTHDDVGWLKTVDQYFYGSSTLYQKAGVQYILDSVIDELLKDEKRRFIYVESAFFFKWFNQQTIEMQNRVKSLVRTGRLEFVGGAWSMNDEAAVHYQSVIDQFTIGLKELSKTFGSCGRPRIGWQIDPFGHSREMASIFAQMGYDGEFFARTDWVEKGERMNNKTAEMIWQGSDHLGEQAELFTGVLYNHYSAPPGFCFDFLCSDEPIIDGDTYENNVKKRVDDFITYIEKISKYFRTRHLLVPMGDDFNYQSAAMNFKNMDKLIKYVNARQSNGSQINIFYSTPGCYLNSVHKLLQTWPTKTQDFFPYSTDWHTYWTGYYTSRPTQKRFEREGNHFLQVVRHLAVFANLTDEDSTNNLNKLREVMGVMQHHDAITGTEKQHVANDYDRLLHDGITTAHRSARQALQKLTNMPKGEFEICLNVNISVCDFTAESDGFVVTLYNPLAHKSTQVVRIPVKNKSYSVYDTNGTKIVSELVPVAKEILAIPYRKSQTEHELLFLATVDKVASYTIKVGTNQRNLKRKPVPKHLQKTRYPSKAFLDEVVVENSLIKLKFDSSGYLYNIQMNGVSENIRQEFYYYNGAQGNNAEFKNRSSGAYIFRPNGSEILMASKVELSIHEGSLVKEVHQHYNEWVSQVIRIYEGINLVEFEWLVGPIPIENKSGKEVITRFSTGVQNSGVFYTDANGREIIKRVRNEREYFTPNLTESISGNYYPITAILSLEDNQTRVALLNDRAQGGSSVADGALELMLHRRLLLDDAFGVGEALNETAFGEGVIARGKLYLILNSFDAKPLVQERQAQRQIHLPFYKFFSTFPQITPLASPQLPSFSSLPQNIDILTFEPFTESEYLLRLESFIDKTVAENVTFNIRDIFDSVKGLEVRETTLDGSMPLSDMKRFKFSSDGTQPVADQYYNAQYTPLQAKKNDPNISFDVEMKPMQIRTFIIKYQ